MSQAETSPITPAPLLDGFNHVSEETRAAAGVIEALLVEEKRLAARHDAAEDAFGHSDVRTLEADSAWQAARRQLTGALEALVATAPCGEHHPRTTAYLRGYAYYVTPTREWRVFSPLEALEQVSHRMPGSDLELGAALRCLLSAPPQSMAS